MKAIHRLGIDDLVGYSAMVCWYLRRPNAISSPDGTMNSFSCNDDFGCDSRMTASGYRPLGLYRSHLGFSCRIGCGASG